MVEFLTNMTWWHWVVGAVALAALEAFVPGAVAVWFAISAALVGLLLVVGRVPSPVSPRAPWRSPFWVTTGDLELALAPGIGPPGSAERKALCRDRLVEDARDRGGWPLAEALAARERRPFPAPPAP